MSHTSMYQSESSNISFQNQMTADGLFVHVARETSAIRPHIHSPNEADELLSVKFLINKYTYYTCSVFSQTLNLLLI